MKEIDHKTAGTGMGFTSFLLLLFIALKLCHIIDWSWWWVLSPIWVPLVFVAVVMLLALIVYVAKG